MQLRFSLRRTLTLNAAEAGFTWCLLPLSILLLTAGAVQADERTVLPEVVVTARPLSPIATVLTAEQVRDEQKKVAGGVAVVESSLWREGRAATPEDMLKLAPGVFSASRFGSEESRVSIRGSGLQRTFHGRGLMFLQDGVPLTLADGGGDFQAFEPAAAQYVEVLRGSNALQYGSGTLGGALNFVTPSGYDAEDEVRIEGGSFGHQRVFAQLSEYGEKADVVIAASHYGREGFQEHAKQSTQRLFANMGYRNNDSIEQRFYFSAVESDSELPGSLTRDELRSGDVRKAAPASVSGDNKRDFDLYRVTYKLNWSPVKNGKLSVSSFYAMKNLFHPIFQVLEQDNKDYGGDLRWTQTGVMQRKNDRIVIGLRQHSGRTHEDRFQNVGGQSGARTDESDQFAANTTVYGEYSWEFNSRYSLIAGVQHISSLRRFEDLCSTATTPSCSGADASFSKRFDAVLPRLGIIVNVKPDVQVFTNLSGLYEPPSFGEINGANVAQLDAQEGHSLEIGSRGSIAEWGDFEWDVALYQAQLRNELLAIQTAPNTFNTLNADHTIHRGIEAAMSFKPHSLLQARLNYLNNDFRYDDDAVYGNNPIAGVPVHVFNGELLLRLSNSGLYVGPTLQAASASWVDHKNQVRAPSYVVYGVKLGQTLSPQWSWFLEGRNLTDKVYAATHGVVGDATLLSFGQPQRLFNPGDGRALYAGITWRP